MWLRSDYIFQDLRRQKFASKEGVVPAQQPPDDSLETTIEELRRKQEEIRKKADRQIARLERMIQVALEDDSASAQVPATSIHKLPPVRPDQFKEVGKFHAMVAYLRDRPGQIPISKIREDLKAEGVILCGKVRKGQTRTASEEGNLIITAGSHYAVLGCDKAKRTIWLKSLGSYTGPPKKRHRPR
jgi:hypothetical protein